MLYQESSATVSLSMTALWRCRQGDTGPLIRARVSLCSYTALFAPMLGW